MGRRSFSAQCWLRCKVSLHESIGFCLTLGAAMFASASHAQVTIDMSRVTRAEYIALPAMQY
jgi:hypothetical protein